MHMTSPTTNLRKRGGEIPLVESVPNRSNIRPEHGRYRVYVIGSRACIYVNRRLCWVCSFERHDEIFRVTTKSNQWRHRPLIGTEDVRKLFLDEKDDFQNVNLIGILVMLGQCSWIQVEIPSSGDVSNICFAQNWSRLSYPRTGRCPSTKHRLERH